MRNNARKGHICRVEISRPSAARLAEARCSANEIIAISGHATMKEIVRYTVATDQARLARNAMTRTVMR